MFNFQGTGRPLLNTPSAGFNNAFQGFANYGGPKDALGMAFYPMRFAGLKDSFGRAAQRPAGEAWLKTQTPDNQRAWRLMMGY